MLPLHTNIRAVFKAKLISAQNAHAPPDEVRPTFNNGYGENGSQSPHEFLTWALYGDEG
jgi:hypothetical protein